MGIEEKIKPDIKKKTIAELREERKIEKYNGADCPISYSILGLTGGGLVLLTGMCIGGILSYCFNNDIYFNKGALVGAYLGASSTLVGMVADIGRSD